MILVMFEFLSLKGDLKWPESGYGISETQSAVA